MEIGMPATNPDHSDCGQTPEMLEVTSRHVAVFTIFKAV